MAAYSNSRRPPPPFFNKRPPPDPTSNFDQWALEQIIGQDQLDQTQGTRTIASLVSPTATPTFLHTAGGAMPLASLIAIPQTGAHSQQWCTQIPIGDFWTWIPRNTGTAAAGTAVWLDHLKIRLDAYSYYLGDTAVPNFRRVDNPDLQFRMLLVEINHDKSLPGRVSNIHYTAGQAAAAGPVAADFLVEPAYEWTTSQYDSLPAVGAAAGLPPLSQRALNSPLRPSRSDHLSEESLQIDTGLNSLTANIGSFTGRLDNYFGNQTLNSGAKSLRSYFKDIFGHTLGAGCPADKIHVQSPWNYRVIHDQIYKLDKIRDDGGTVGFVPQWQIDGLRTGGVPPVGDGPAEPVSRSADTYRGCSIEVPISIRRWYDWTMPAVPGGGQGGIDGQYNPKGLYLMLIPSQSVARYQGQVPGDADFGNASGTVTNLRVRTANIAIRSMTIEQAYQRDLNVELDEPSVAMHHNAVDGNAANDAARRPVGHTVYRDERVGVNKRVGVHSGSPSKRQRKLVFTKGI